MKPEANKGGLTARWQHMSQQQIKDDLELLAAKRAKNSKHLEILSELFTKGDNGISLKKTKNEEAQKQGPANSARGVVVR